ncbi:hypothetical protein [Kiloniella sp. b19]|uniref:hypothetical protein n=1 Tax=Kiloniella sp. GXU_MW_B19 TaxID=3141326 RepID=UPI0031D0F9BE
MAIRFSVSSVLTALASVAFVSFGAVVSDSVQVANAQAVTLPASSSDAAVAGSRDVTLFDGENQDGQARRWSLPAGQPYRFVPDLGPGLNSAVSSLKVGGEIGVILFGQPQFGNVDSQCAPVIGDGKSTRAFWLGATADFLPDNPQTGSHPVSAQAPQNDFYQSMILFQRDMGPPPGALFLQRLNSYSQGCRSALDRLNYQRLFVPAWDQGATASCRNLVGPSSYGGTDTVLKFNAAERLYVMGPGKFDRGYLPIKHDVSVTIYKQLDCQGNGVTLPRPGTSLDSFNLNDYGLGRTARSVKVRYLSGPAASYTQSVAVQPRAQDFQVQPKVVETAPLPETVEEQAVSALATAVENQVAPVDTAATGTAPVPVQPAEALPEVTGELQAPPAVSSPARSVAVQPSNEAVTLPQRAPASVEAPTASGTAEAASVAPSAPASAAVVVPAEPVQVPAAVVQQSPAVPANTANLAALYESAGIFPAGDDSIIPKPEPVPEAALRPRSSASTSTSNELFTPSYQLFSPDTEGQVSSVQPLDESPAPSSAPVTLAPVTLPSSPAAPSQSVTLPSEAAQAVEEEEIANDPDSFENPVVGSFRLNYCRLPGEDCGKPAAVEWCQAKGYQTATRWALDRNIGALFPTANIGDGTVCSSFQCSGFRYVSCGG